MQGKHREHRVSNEFWSCYSHLVAIYQCIEYLIYLFSDAPCAWVPFFPATPTLSSSLAFSHFYFPSAFSDKWPFITLKPFDSCVLQSMPFITEKLNTSTSFSHPPFPIYTLLFVRVLRAFLECHGCGLGFGFVSGGGGGANALIYCSFVEPEKEPRSSSSVKRMLWLWSTFC